MAKKKKIYKDPALQAGYDRLKMLNQEAAEYRNITSNVASQGSGYGIPVDKVDYSTLNSEQDGYLFDESKPITEESSGVLDTLKNTASSVGQGISEFGDDVVDTWRALCKRVSQSLAGDTAFKLMENANESEVNKKIKDYLQDVQTVEGYLGRNDLNADEIQDLTRRMASIEEAEMFFKTQGRQYDQVIDILYGSTANAGNLERIDRYLAKDYRPANKNDNFVMQGLQHMGNSINTITSAVEFLFDGFREADKKILKSASNGSKIIDDSFKNHNYIINNIQALRDKADRYGNTLDRDQRALTQEYLDRIDTYLNGNALFDPRKIDPTYAKRQEQYSGEWSLRGLGYDIPELGSTLSMFWDMAKMTSADLVSGAIAKKLPGVLIRAAGEKGTLAAKALTTAADAIPTLLSGAALGYSIDTTREMRRKETAQEAIDAISQRTMLIASNNGADLTKVFKNIIEFAKDNNIDPSGLKPEELVTLALAYNIPTGDGKFEQAKRNSLPGLQKLINENNSLAYIDYLQALPFLHNTRGMVSRYLTRNYYGDEYAGKISKDLYGGKNIFKQRMLDDANLEIQSTFDAAIDKATRAFVKHDMPKLAAISATVGKINKIPQELLKRGMTKSALMAKTTGAGIKNTAKTLVPVGIEEGVEEGVQHLLQQRYQRGEYDDYDRPSSMFNIGDVFANVNLAQQAVLASMGLLDGDLENDSKELRRAMTIGTVSGMMFPLGFGAVKNLVPNNEHSFRGFVSQLKNDYIVGSIVGSQYSRNEDEKHIQMYTDMLHRTGVHGDNIEKTLRNYKKLAASADNKSLITPEDIDDEISLMRSTEVMYNNKFLKDFIKDQGEKLYGDFHNTIIKQGAMKIQDAKTIQKKNKEAQRNINNRWTKKLQDIEDLVFNVLSDGQKGELLSEHPEYRKFVEALRKDYVDFQKKEDEKARKALKDAISGKDDVDTESVIPGVNEYLRIMFGASLNKFMRTKMRQAISDLEQKHLTDQEITRQFGIDIPQDELMSMIDGIRNHLKNLERVGAEYINDGVNLYDKDMSDSKRKQVIDSRIAVLDKKLEEYGDIFGVDDEFSMLVNAIALNTGALKPTRDLAAMYINGNTDPQAVQKAIFGDSMPSVFENSSQDSENDPNYDIIKAFANFEQFVNDYNTKKLDDGTVIDNTDYEQQKAKKASDIAKAIIKKRAKRRMRNHVAHDAKLDEIINQNTIDKAEAGDVHAQESIDKAIDQQQVQDASAEAEIQRNVDDRIDSTADTQSKALNEAKSRFEGQSVSTSVRLEQAKADLLEKLKQKATATQAKADATFDQNVGRTLITKTPRVNNPNSLPIIDQLNNKLRNVQAMEKVSVISESSELNVNVSDIKNLDSGVHVIGVQKIDDNGTTYTIYHVLNVSTNEVDGEITKSFDYKQIAESVPENLKDNFDENHISKNAQLSDILKIEDGNYQEQSSEQNQETNNGSLEVKYSDSGAISEVTVDNKTLIPIGTVSNQDNPSEESKENTDTNRVEVEQEEAQNAESVLAETHAEVQIKEVTNQESEQQIDQQKQIDELRVQQQESIINQIISSEIQSVASGFNFVNGVMYYNLSPLSPDQLDETLRQVEAIQRAEYGRFNSNLQQYNPNGKEEVRSKNDLTDYISSTFFYKPDATEPMELKIGKKDIKLPYTLRSGSELAKKLLNPDWINNCEKYYVISKPVIENQDDNSSDSLDDFSVTLIIQDNNEKACYAASLRGLSKKDSVGVSKESDLRRWMEMLNADVRYDENGQEILQDGKTYAERFNLMADALAPEEYSLVTGRMRPQLNDFSNPEDYAKAVSKFEKDAVKWYRKGYGEKSSKQDVELWEKAAKRIRLRARQQLALPLRNILSEDQIDQQIEKLRQARNEIIEKYCTKVGDKYVLPDEIRTDVIPAAFNVSNGKFNNIKKDDVPVLQSLNFENNPFGLPKTASEIGDAIEKGNVVFGIGSGVRFGFALRDIREKFRTLILGPEVGDEDGKPFKGLSGKIYVMVKGPSGKSVPLMLTEEKLSKQEYFKDGKRSTKFIGGPNSVKLCLDPSTGDINFNKDGILPSLAECVLYMIAGRISSNMIPGGRMSAVRPILDFIVHNGEETLLQNSDTENKLQFLAEKQFCWFDGDETQPAHLEIGIMDSAGKYRRTSYTYEQIFNPDDDSIRRTVVSAIAKQLHWNTDQAMMNENFSGANLLPVQEMLRYYFEHHPNDTEFKLFGLEQLTFKREDFFDVSSHGQDDITLITKNNVTGLSWMLANGKLLTDVNEQVFKDPFIFAGGVKQATNTTEEDTSETIVNTPETSSQDTTPIVKPVDITESLKSVTGAKTTGDILYSTKEEKEESFSEYNNLVQNTFNGDVPVDVFFVDIPGYNDPIFNDESLWDFADKLTAYDKDEYMAYVRDKVEQAVDKYNSANNTQIQKNKIIYNATDEAIYQNMHRDMPNAIITVVITKNGNAMVDLRMKANKKIRVSGVYSQNRQNGSVDGKAARQWLHDKLGIDPKNIIVSNAIFKSCTDADVFGFVTTVLDSLTQEITGRIILSNEEGGGSGLHYHEAWHYVNLLMHNSDERMFLYKEYAKSHKLYGKEAAEIEEEMAEDFRKWMEMQEDKTIFGKVKKFFNNVLDLLIASRRKSAYRQVYRDIRDGKYKGQSLDKESLRIFHEKYADGAQSQQKFYRPGLSNVQINRFKAIHSYREFDAAASSLINYIFDKWNITTYEQMVQIGKGKFQEAIQELRNLAKTKTTSQADIINDICDNPDAFKSMLLDKFQEYGLRVRFKRFEKDDLKADQKEPLDETGEDPLEAEEAPTEVFDVYQIEMSHKDNASLRTKMFLRRIPDCKYVTTRSGKRVIQYEVDELLGTTKYVDFGEAWNKIQEQLWECESYAKRYENNQFTETSFRGIIKRAKKSDAFFEMLDKRLDELDSDKSAQAEELRSQILNSIKASKMNILMLELQDEVARFSKQDLEIQATIQASLASAGINISNNNNVVADRDRLWVYRNDNTLRAVRNIPRKWSKAILMSGMVDYSKDGSVVSQNYANLLKSNMNSIIYDYEELQRLNKLLQKGKITEAQVLSKITAIKQKLISLYNIMSIPFDEKTMDMFMMSVVDQKQLKGSDFPATLQYEALKHILANPSKGNIRQFVETIVNSAGKRQLFPKYKNDGIDLDQLFQGFKRTSDISKMALAMNSTHPSSSEFSVRGTNGQTYYPITQNNGLTDKIRWLNTTNGKHAQEMRQSQYCRNSIMLKKSETQLRGDVTEDNKFIVSTFVGLKDSNHKKGDDYFGITAMEDYISKMIILDQDPEFSDLEQTNLISPTMADKKGWNTIRSGLLRTSHDAMIANFQQEDLDEAIQYAYYQYQHMLYDYMEDDTYLSKEDADLWYRNLGVDDPVAKYINQLATTIAMSKPDSKVRRFSDGTLSIFAGYLLDEFNTLIDYYSRANIKYLLENPNKRTDNYDGTFDENGRMQFDGNGGLFRYFYDLKLDDSGLNLNNLLELLYNTQKKIEAGKIDRAGNTESSFDKVSADDLIKMDVEREDKKDRSLDGFELIRGKLQELKNRYFENGVPNKQLLNAINDNLQDLVHDELEELSTNESMRIIWKDSFGHYNPLGIPKQLLSRYAKRLSNYGIIKPSESRYYRPYSSPRIDQDALYSLIANNVVNEMISIIECEKVITGDPAAYKYKNHKNPRTVSCDITLKDGTIINATESVHMISEKYSDKIKRLGSVMSPGSSVRNDYSQDELNTEFRGVKINTGLDCSTYTNLNIQDIVVQSTVIKDIMDHFERQLLVDIIRCETPDFFNEFSVKKYADYLKKENGSVNLDKINKQEAFEYGINRIYDDYKTFQYLKNKLDSKLKKEIDERLPKQIGPYNKITVADAQVIIRPEMYRRIRKGLGEWSSEDEAAYRILEKDGSWMKDPAKAKIVRKLQLYPLKMSYFSNEIVEFAPGQYRCVPIYNKMAIFPLFKYTATGADSQALYTRMNKPGNELDMVSFKSAVKVGGKQNAYNPYGKQADSLSSMNDAINNDSDYSINYETGEINQNSGDNTLAVTIQNINDIRLQLNTKAHESDERAIGTQMFKIAFSNIIDNALYGRGKSGRHARKGYDIKEDIIACINALTLIGADEIRDKFFTYNNKTKQYSTNNLEIQKLVTRIAKNNGLGSTAQEILQNSGVIASLMSRQVFENSVSKAVNREVIKINTKGGTAIQQSVFGFAGYGNSEVAPWCDTFHNYNGGEELKWDAKEGSMQVILSANFFKSVVPLEHQGTVEDMRAWLIKNNIIGQNAKPFGIGYRIPTQGMSSMFAFQVVDILPEQSGDLIIVPREFTAQTGSDFDVDKLYLATFSYTNGKLDTLEFDKKLKGSSLQKALKESGNVGAITNRLLTNYIDIISDMRNYGASRASIDVITKNVTENLVPILQGNSGRYQKGMSELLPSFQTQRKLEFTTGKDGIGSFAWNITNMSLTQYTHMCLDFGEEVKAYGLVNDNPLFGNLDCIYGEDHNRVADWLSAMVNAHVDVAKDPYIFVLNVNKATYNHTNLLLRCGKGITTFTFLAQPILKSYATLLNNSGGMYGKNLDGRDKSTKMYVNRSRDIQDKLIVRYQNNIKACLENYKDVLDKDKYAYYDFQSKLFGQKADQIKKLLKDTNNQKYLFDEKLIFNYDYAIKMIKIHNAMQDISKGMYSGDYTYDVIDMLDYYVYQLNVLNAFNKISKYADSMSELVKMSQIDTEKFGNNIPDQINFINSYEQFKYNSSATWFIRGKESEFVGKKFWDYETKKMITLNDNLFPLRYYFNQLFLDTKLYQATGLTKAMLKRQTFTATDAFERIIKSIFGSINGFSRYYKTTPYSYLDKESKKYVSDLHIDIIHGYKPILKQDLVKKVAYGVDSIIRNLALSSAGPHVYDTIIGRFYNKKNKNFEKIFINTGKNADIFPVKRSFKYGSLVDRRNNIYDDKSYRLFKSIFQDMDTPLDIVRDDSFDGSPKNIATRIFLGDESMGNMSLPKRLATIQNKIKNNPTDYSELVDSKGRISNELLNNLISQNASEDYPIDRIILSENQITQSDNKKAIMMGAFYQLLTYSEHGPNDVRDQEIRNLARDIALYAYYSTYDTNESNSFFDLVPTMFRKQYDESLKYALNVSSNELTNLLIQGGSLRNAADRIFDILCRNYWYDNDIVPEYTLSSKNNSRLWQGGESKLQYASVKFGKRSINMPGCIITSTTNKPYIKVTKKGCTVLYKLVGETSNQKNVDKPKKTASVRYIYMATQKAGVHSNNQHQYEYYADYSTSSIFPQNKLPQSFNPFDLRKTVDTILQKSNESSEYTTKPIYYLETLPDELSGDNSDMYFEEPKSQVQTLENGVTVKSTSNVVKSIEDYSDLIITIDGEQTDNKKYFNIDSSKDLQSQIEQMISEKNIGNNSISIGVFSNGIKAVQAKPDELKSWIENRVDVLVKEFTEQNEDATQADIDEYRKSIENESKNIANEEVLRIKRQQFIGQFITQLLMNNIGIKTINTSADNITNIDIAAASVEFKDEFKYRNVFSYMEDKRYNDDAAFEEFQNKMTSPLDISIEAQKEYIEPVVQKIENAIEKQETFEEDPFDILGGLSEGIDQSIMQERIQYQQKKAQDNVENLIKNQPKPEEAKGPAVDC